MFKIEYIMLNEKDKYEFFNNSTYIYGTNNVGKTLFYKTLYYILGTSEETIWNEIGMENVNEIYCKVSNHVSMLFLKRNKDHKLFYKRSELDDYLPVDRDVYVAEIQKLIHHDSILENNYLNSVEEKLSYRGWAYLNFIDEHSLGNISPIITTANDVKSFKRIHRQMDFIFDYENLVKLNKLLDEKELIEEQLKEHKTNKEKYDHLIELINHYLTKLNISNDGKIEDKEKRFNIYLKNSEEKYDEVMIKNNKELTYLLKASAYLEEQIKIDSAYDNQNFLVNTKNKKIKLLLESLETALQGKEQYSNYMNDIKEILTKNEMVIDLISLKDYASSIKYLKDKKNVIDKQISLLENSIKENTPEDIIKYVNNLKTYFDEIKLIPNFDEYTTLSESLKSKNEEISDLKKILGNYNSSSINKFLTSRYLSIPIKTDYVEEDKKTDKFEMRFLPSTLSINAYREEKINDKKILTHYYPGSKARFTCWQLLGYISLYSYIIDKFGGFPILPLLVIDGFNEPFDDKSDKYKGLVDYFSNLCNKMNIQLIIMATRNDINYDNVNYIDLSKGFNSSRKSN